jgi:tRNA (cmo5U34)-methyltransferase
MTFPSNRDRIFAEPLQTPADFVFDERVAEVFADMLQRSIPGYATILQMIGLLAATELPATGLCYDLGCSLGAAALAIQRACPGRKVIGLDNSPDMLEKARASLALDAPDIQLVEADVETFPLQPAAMVVLNFTLQFLPLEGRRALLERIHQALVPGGLLVLSEKIALDEPKLQQCFIQLHESFKEAKGYSRLEISQKRTALERVLLPESLATHQQRLQAVGFSHQHPWFQCFNFVSILAIKT